MCNFVVFCTEKGGREQNAERHRNITYSYTEGSRSSPVSYLSVAPQLVAFHAVAVVQGDGAVVRNGIEANFFGVHGVAHPDVLSPAERKHLRGTDTWCVMWEILRKGGLP